MDAMWTNMRFLKRGDTFCETPLIDSIESILKSLSFSHSYLLLN